MTTPTWVGRRLAGRYTLEEQLWQREAAAAYHGHDSDGRQVTLTLLSAGAAGGDSFRARFEREARAVAQLRHPNLAPLLDFGVDGEVAYLVREHYSGGTLSARLGGRPLPLAEAARIASAIGSALHYAHSHGITHRNLTSASVLFDGSDQPIVADFGLTAIVGDDGQAGDVHYLAPEQVRGQRGDELSDVYSMAVVAYEMSTGRVPFPGTAPLTVMLAQLNETPPAPHSINPNLSPAWSQALVVALAKEPNARYQTAANLAAALGAPPAQQASAPPRTQIEPRPPSPVGGTMFEQPQGPPRTVHEPRQPPPSSAGTMYEPARSQAPGTVVEPRAPQPPRPGGTLVDAARPPSWPPGSPPSHPPGVIETPPGPAGSWPPGGLPQPAQPAPARRVPMSTLLFAGVAGVLLIGLVAVVAIAVTMLGNRGGGGQGSPTNTPPGATADSAPSSEGMVEIAAGAYPLGVNKSGSSYASARTVDLPAFWIDQYEITNAEYSAFVASGGSSEPYGWQGGQYPSGQDRHPVRGVSFDQAAAYCVALGKRLPQEAEWEVAARGPQGLLYPWGDDPNVVKFDPSSTYPVGTLEQNKSWAGVYDMAANVWEWVSAPYEPVASGHQVLRGGSFNFPQDMAYRLDVDPAVLTAIVDSGFRCAATEVR